MDAQENKNIVALLEGADLSDEVKLQVSTLFETAVSMKVAEEVAQVTESVQAQAEEKLNSIVEGVTNAADEYISEAVKTWMDENKLVIESENRVQRADRLFEAIKTAMAEANMQLDEDAEVEINRLHKLVESKDQELDAKDAELEEARKEIDALKTQIVEYALKDAFDTMTADLSESQKLRLKEVTANIYCESVDEYVTKVGVIKSALFNEGKSAKADDAGKEGDEDDLNKANPDQVTDADDGKEQVKENLDPVVNRFVQMLG